MIEPSHGFKIGPQTHIAPPLLRPQACGLAIVWVLLRLFFESCPQKISHQFVIHSVPRLRRSLTVLEGFSYIIVTEASKAERPRHFAVLLSDRFAWGEERAERVETNEEVLFGHYVIGVG